MAGESFDYKKAGVDIEAAEKMVEGIKGMVWTTFRPGVLTEIGGFAGLFEPDLQLYENPVFAAATDGVGTKLKIAFMLGKHDTVGIDLVAMCVNDLLVQGAAPLFFLDYLAVGKLEHSLVTEIISGVVEGCRQAGCSLLGGETAEMPGFYSEGEYDLAGFAVGIVDKEKIISGQEIAPGDLLLGLSSTGLHSNGYSLVRKVLLEHAGLSLQAQIPGLDTTLGEELLKPTAIYAPLLLPLLQEYKIKGLAHITGGGMGNNLQRVLPVGLRAIVKSGSWEAPAIFPLIQELGNVKEEDMLRTFNMGVGMILVVPPETCAPLLRQIEKKGTAAWEIGLIEEGEAGKVSVVIE